MDNNIIETEPFKMNKNSLKKYVDSIPDIFGD